MKQRPPINKGDLVRLKGERDGLIYRVRGIKKVDRVSAKKMGIASRPATSDGAARLLIQHLLNLPIVVNRRDVWLIPNQPRNRYLLK